MAEKKANKKQIRLLNASDIECRVGTMKADGTGCSLLLYKDARVDMKILDEVYGELNWKREHHTVNNNLFCTVSVWDADKHEWISKQDVGTESNAEKEKGQASDAFKRACVNWGIGRELYTAPFIWIKLTPDDTYKSKNGFGLNGKFHVKQIGYNDDREIEKLVVEDWKGRVRYTYGKVEEKVVQPPQEPVVNIPGVFSGAQLQAAISEMRATKNRQEMYDVWHKYKEMQGVKEFYDFTIARGKELGC